LEFRTPAVLRSIERLSETQLHWQPPHSGNSIAWLLWHIPEVEDNWVRDKLLNRPKRYPFGESVNATSGKEWPSKAALVSYFHEIRSITRERLEQTPEEEFDRTVSDEHFGSITVRQVWGGVVTSCAWHGGQIVLNCQPAAPKRWSRIGCALKRARPNTACTRPPQRVMHRRQHDRQSLSRETSIIGAELGGLFAEVVAGA
jgi:hypothetical protein